MHQPSRSWFLFLSLLLLFGPPCSRADQSLHVNESNTKIQLDNQRMVVSLAIENSGGRRVRGHVEIELVDPKGESQGKAERDQDIPVGSSRVPLEVTIPNLKPADIDSVFWYRLRYKISAADSGNAPTETVSGIVSISEIAPEMFVLRLAYPDFAQLGTAFQAVVRAVRPATLRPVAGVKIQGTLDVSDTDSIPPVRVSATTDSQGYATLKFSVPVKTDTDRPTLKVTGQRGGYTATLDNEEILTSHFSNFLLSTDKPLYQPGQTLHARILAFGADQHAAANQKVELRILDPEETLVFRTSLKTSQFGIASADWPIPANQRLGDYKLRTDFGEDDSEDGGSSATVKINRYELPNFTVMAKPDRSYYLGDQNAAVEVRADYLFGQPVTRGHVRVVGESSRQWNFREQKWDIGEGDVYEGETDASGRYTAKIDLSKPHKEVTEEDYTRFRDYDYTAYFTDPTTGRTEHRRFDLRVTKEPIHIYVIPAEHFVSKNSADFYLSTSYADGTPAPCEVSIRTAETKSAKGEVHVSQLLRTIHTNRYGVAKVFDLKTPADQADDEPPLVFHATDAKGASGIHTEDLQFYSSPAIRVTTDKTLYRPDDSIEVQLLADDADGTVEVEATTSLRFISSQMVRLRHGKATVMFEPNDKFQGPVTIEAYELGGQSIGRYDETSAQGSHTILFPHDTSLQLDVRMSKAKYRPGEEAGAEFRVNSTDGGAAKSALGLVVVDKAVEERQRTDEDLGRNSGFYAFRAYGDGENELSGIHRADLDRIDPSKPLPEGLELVAEILLQRGGNGLQFDSSGDNTDLHRLFAAVIDPPLVSVAAALRTQISEVKTMGGEAAIRRFLATTKLSSLRDPWGVAYQVYIEPRGANYEIRIESAGPDKKFDTADDFGVASDEWPYFGQYAAVIQKAVEDYHARTGGYIRDEGTLKPELLSKGLDFDSLRDPWGRGYQLDFGINHTSYTIEVRSAGPDGNFSSANAPSYDDAVVCNSSIGYFDDSRGKMDAALDRYYHGAGHFPQNERDMADAFRAGGVGWESLRDPWGHPYYAIFRQESQYSDAISVQTYAEYVAGQHTAIQPVTREFNFIEIHSGGPDGKEGTADDFEAATFSRAVYAQPGDTRASTATETTFSGELGAVSGEVTDPAGAVIAGARVAAKRNGTGETYDATTDRMGKFLLRNLRAGAYEVHFFSAGFRERVLTDVPVRSSAVTGLNAVLSVGAVTQTVTVEATAVPVQTQAAALSRAMPRANTSKFEQVKAPVAELSTPRLREYFPETLLWQPELVTDSHGAARLTFPLADSITTWKLAVIASTLDGRIGTAEKEVRAFQPFFADQDLPQNLTAGDEIGLPVIVRNYLDHPESVELKLDPQPWLKLSGPAAQHAEIAANDSARVIFPMRAGTPIKEGKVRLTATGRDAADAMEKKTMVRPFGEEKSASTSQMLGSSSVLDLSTPETALPGSVEAELKVYPNLMAHVWEAMEAILERPYGCGEQTISSTYPSILLLRYAKEAGREMSPETLRAQRYAQLGYDRLLSYQAPDGGFTYWGRGDTDLALTAYAVRFLQDAKEVIPVDDSVTRRAQSWLVNQIKPDGHWVATSYWGRTEDLQRSVMLTAYIARVLAATMTAGAINDEANKELAGVSQRSLGSALAWLGPRTEQRDEPYLVAAYALALLDSGGDENRAAAEKALKRLRSLAHDEGDTTYWSLETNTPFYGWGRAGRLETTALVVEALERGTSADAGIDRSPIDRGILFLLRNQDRYGIWYSTQATINVLRAMAHSLSARASGVATSSEAAILIDGKPAGTISLPPSNKLSAPVITDISNFLGPGEHRVEITRPAGAPEASVQLAESYYVPWNGDAAKESMRREKNSAEALRLVVSYDKTRAKIGERINCTVKAERVDFRGYGMMLAEIGLPPGAEVDRASLDKAMTDSGWDINQFDVLPDRVIVYLWPHAGGTTFSFAFATRFGIDAETARSVLYDYYNPDAQTVVAPTRMVAQ
jgi:A-macroglobulin TED domain/Alpha-2-macroglobulin family/MG2 domain/Carboxypeptidase regulatory-like domain/A-macroglobulin receptor binding domain/Macroglobulin domain MG3